MLVDRKLVDLVWCQVDFALNFIRIPTKMIVFVISTAFSSWILEKWSFFSVWFSSFPGAWFELLSSQRNVIQFNQNCDDRKRKDLQGNCLRNTKYIAPRKIHHANALPAVFRMLGQFFYKQPINSANPAVVSYKITQLNSNNSSLYELLVFFLSPKAAQIRLLVKICSPLKLNGLTKCHT